MKQKIAAIAIMAVFVFSCAAFAQKTGLRGKPAGQKAGLGRIARQLNLSSDQVKSITQIVKKYHVNVRDVAESNVARDEKQSRIKALRQSAHQSIMGVLNADQQAKAKKTKLVDTLLNRKRGNNPLFGVLVKLNLTDQQKASIKSITKDSADRVKAIRQDTSLTSDAKRAGCKEIREETISRIKGQLTTGQLQKFNELMQKKPAAKRK